MFYKKRYYIGNQTRLNNELNGIFWGETTEIIVRVFKKPVRIFSS